jgi:hypothetical protein
MVRALLLMLLLLGLLLGAKYLQGVRHLLLLVLLLMPRRSCQLGSWRHHTGILRCT